MQHLIIGYGYCGYYLAQALLAKGEKVTAIARTHKAAFKLAGLDLIEQDISLKPLLSQQANTVLYYLIPPRPESTKDTLLNTFLHINNLNIKTFIYFGSSAVYSEQQGQWVNENTICHVSNPRALRRLDAERQILNYSTTHNIRSVILRIAGIYGPQRLPIEAARSKTPCIKQSEAPFINHIAVTDLAEIARLLAHHPTASGLFNVADGKPAPMGDLQKQIAAMLNLEEAPSQSFQEALQEASSMRKEFMSSSKRLDITKLNDTLGPLFKPSSIPQHLSHFLDQKEFK